MGFKGTSSRHGVLCIKLTCGGCGKREGERTQRMTSYKKKGIGAHQTFGGLVQ
jgi:hypothetical protein